MTFKRRNDLRKAVIAKKIAVTEVEEVKEIKEEKVKEEKPKKVAKDK